MADREELKKKLVSACRILDKEGVMDELGHFSARCPGEDRVWINGKISPGQAREDDLVLVDLDGTKVEGEREPPSETPLHLTVYRKRADVLAVAHTHSPTVVALSVAGVKLRPVDVLGAQVFGSEVPLYEGYGLVDSFHMGFDIAEAMGSHDVIVLKGHGNIVAGRSIEEACVFALWTEKAALMQYRAMLLGEPHWYPQAEIEKLRQQAKVRGRSFDRTWNYYQWKAGP